MKILMMSDLYPPIITGGGRHVQTLSLALKRKGHDVAVCTVGGNNLPCVRYHSTEQGIRVYRMQGLWQKMPFLFRDPAKRWHPPVQDPLLTREISRIIRKEKPDVLHAHGWILCSYLPLDKKFTIPLVLTLHGYGLVCPKQDLMRGSEICERSFTDSCIVCGSSRKQYGFIKSFFAYFGVKSLRKKIGSVDKFIAVSSFVKEFHLKHLDIDEKCIDVIPNFYDRSQDHIDNVTSLESQVLPEDFILFVGVLAPFKGVNTLLEAYDKMDTQTSLVIIGVKYPGHDYVARARGATIIENAPRRTVLAAYRKCKLVVIPSTSPDPCPTTALEAMSYSKPIVASLIGGLKDIVIDGVTGILVPPNNSRRLMEAVMQLLQDTDMRQKMGNLGYKRLVASFSVDQVVSKVESVYESVLA